MDNYRTILKRVGLVVIAVGIFNLIYSFSVTPPVDQDDLSGFTAFVVVGVLLFRGNLRIVPIVTWIVALIISCYLSTLLILYPLDPIELWLTKFSLDPINLSLLLFHTIIAIALSCWVYIQLRTASVVRATQRAGHSNSTPRLAFILGIIFVVVMVGIMQSIRTGEAGAKAIAIAQEQYGEEYEYHITGMSWESGQIRTNLVAYNQQEIKPVQVQWNR
ncbi:MAG: hypothetical protein SWJ54_15740 [Cyanobacteriota bacterium]|nr:hypothetical protein [Cyanobacteriota bacterium]